MSLPPNLVFDFTCKQALQRLYNEPMHRGSDGKMHERNIGARISPEQGAALASTIQQHGCKHTLEIGFANGFSTLYILGAIKHIPGAHHTSIDPWEESIWQGIGLEKVKEVGAEAIHRWMPHYSLNGFAKLTEAEEKFDYIFIDGNHLFDGVILDICGADCLLEPGGIMALDDLWMPAVTAAVSFVQTNYAHYKRLQSPSSNMALFQKIAKDTRQWFHYQPFEVPKTIGAWDGDATIKDGAPIIPIAI